MKRHGMNFAKKLKKLWKISDILTQEKRQIIYPNWIRLMKIYLEYQLWLLMVPHMNMVIVMNLFASRVVVNL